MSRRPTSFPIEPQRYRGAVPDGLPAVAPVEPQAASTLASVSEGLARKFSAWADQDAKYEGDRDAKIAAASGDFAQSGAGTIYGRARDATAGELQVQSVTSQFRDRTLALYDAHRNDPEALRNALNEEARLSESVLPVDARAAFRNRASDISITVQRQSRNNQEAARRDEAQAVLLRNAAASARRQSQILSVSPSDPQAEALARQEGDQQIDAIQNLVRTNLMDASAGERQIQQIRAGTEDRIIQARAATLTTPEEIDAYRAQLRRDFHADKLPGVTDIQSVDEGLQRLSQQRRVQGDQQFRQLNTRVDDALARAAKGQLPPVEEMAQLESEAGRLGPRGQALLANARSLMGAYNQMAGMSIQEQARFVQNVRSAAGQASSRSTPEEQSAAAYLRNRGLTPLQAAAVTSYMLAESTLDPNANAARDGRDGSDSVGMGQWNAGRATALRAFAAARGKPWNDAEVQMDFLLHELNTSEKAAGDRLRAARSPEEATAAMVAFGRPRGWTSGAVGHLGVPSWQARLGNTTRIVGGEVSRSGAEYVNALQTQLDANRSAMNADMLGYAAARPWTLGGGAVTTIDLGAPPDQLAAQVTARVNQVDAVARTLGRPDPAYLRPDDKAALTGLVSRGGEPALGAIEAIVRGGGPRATAILKEIGGDAPALAHAAAISASTGDRTFARTIAEGLAARNVAGARPPRPSGDDMRDAETSALGASLRGMRTDERERTQAAVGLWFEVEAQRRGIDPKQDPARAKTLLEEGFRAARGETRQGDNTYGGVTAWRGRGWFGGEVQVQVPPSIRQDRFGAVLGALTDQDLAGLPNPPVTPSGAPMDAGALRRMQPIFGPGGYRWSMPPDSSGNRRPVMGKDGQPFVLDLQALEPELRRRVPDAFR